MNEDMPGAAPVTKLERLQYSLRHIWWATEVLEKSDDSPIALGHLDRARDALIEQLDDFYKHSDTPEGWERVQQWAKDHGKIVVITQEVDKSQLLEK